MAVRALAGRHHVRSRQRESRFRVIKCRRLPRCRVVTGIAGLSESAGHVVGIVCALKILQVTRHTGRARQVVVIVDVAIAAGARRYSVRAGQYKIDHRVIEGCRLPGYGGMALRAIGGEIRSHVVGVRGPLKILEMAGNACRARQVVIVAYMAIDALPGRDGMPSTQREAYGRVVEFSVQPVVGSVTSVASRGKFCLDVVGIAGCLEITEVA